MVRRALSWVLALPEGDIAWARDEAGEICDDALVTGCASIFKSLECAEALAALVGDDPAPYGAARKRFGVALRERPERFDRTWESKARFSMDWFYPVLTGVLSPEAGKARLDARWHEFVEPGLGCRCVSDQPWVTLAETCELTLALLATGQRHRAADLSAASTTGVPPTGPTGPATNLWKRCSGPWSSPPGPPGPFCWPRTP